MDISLVMPEVESLYLNSWVKNWLTQFKMSMRTNQMWSDTAILTDVLGHSALFYRQSLSVILYEVLTNRWPGCKTVAPDLSPPESLRFSWQGFILSFWPFSHCKWHTQSQTLGHFSISSLVVLTTYFCNARLVYLADVPHYLSREWRLWDRLHLILQAGTYKFTESIPSYGICHWVAYAYSFVTVK